MRLKKAKTTPAQSPSPKSHVPMSHAFACHAPAGRFPEPLSCVEDGDGAVWAGLRQDPVVTPLPLQLVKKVVQSGDTACLQSTLAVFCHEDRQLLWGHCHCVSRCVYTLHAHTATPTHTTIYTETQPTPDLKSEMFSEVQKLTFFCGSDKVLFLPLSAGFGLCSFTESLGRPWCSKGLT